ncbi:MAG TPA: Gfo/Idh/MocA family oxidoreductase [Gaiellaceae bacterium]
MIIVDTALAEREQRGDPIQVGLVGAGFFGTAVAKQITRSVPGMRIAAISNRTVERARSAYERAGVDDVAHVSSASELDAAVERGQAAITDDPDVLCEAEGVDAILEATGTVAFGAGVALSALEAGKHLVLVNAELDATLGPILKRYADRAGVVLTDGDGDQPAVQVNLARFARSLGLRPVLCGNVKGLMDHYRTPETQKGFAEKTGQAAYMAASFADGSKISFEQAVTANALGMPVQQRGMVGYQYDGYVDEPEHLALYDADDLSTRGGVVDYVLGAKPGASVFVLAVHDDPEEHHFLDLYKLGPGPLYCLHAPFHLCYFEAPLTIARAVDFGDAAAAPRGGPVVEVVATAKRDLKAGEALDGIGHYMTYGQCENHDDARGADLLPMGLAEGCTLVRDVPKDAVLTFADVEVPNDRLVDRLWREQEAAFETATTASA